MNILLLGATGYLGRNIARYLSGKGHNLICVVRRTSDISGLKDTDVRLISNEPGRIEEAFMRDKIDMVINSVCTYKPDGSLYGGMIESNLVFPLMVLNLAVKYHIENYMTMGTGLPMEFNVYSFTKAKFSEFGKYLSKKEKINFIDLRLEMFYGGMEEPEDKFMKSSILKLARGVRLDLTEGTQKRDLIRVEDILSLIELLIKTGYVHGYRTLPAGSGENHSIREIIRFMSECCESESETRFGAVQNREGEPDTLADITWYQDIGFELRYPYFEGIKDECRRIIGGGGGITTSPF